MRVFLIYAEHGVAGEELNKTFYRAAEELKQLWRVQGAGHTGGFEAPRLRAPGGRLLRSRAA